MLDNPSSRQVVTPKKKPVAHKPVLKTRLNPQEISGYLLLVIQCAIGIVLLAQRGCEPPSTLLEATNTTVAVAQENDIYIHVIGNVKFPGVYSFTAQNHPTIKDAVEAAGGSTSPVTIDTSLPLSDEAQIVVK